MGRNRHDTPDTEATEAAETTDTISEAEPVVVDDLQHRLLLAEAELEASRPAVLRDNIRAAGYDPDSSAGKVLAELAEGNPDLARSPGALREKARALDLGADPTTPATAGETRALHHRQAPAANRIPGHPNANFGDDLNDPRFPPNHPRNDPNDAAYKAAQRQRALEQKAAEMVTSMSQADENGFAPGTAHPAEQRPANLSGFKPVHPEGYKPHGHGTPAEQRFKNKNASLWKAMKSQG